MTPEQQEARDERVAIMAVEGMSEEEAEAYCDTKPWLYGARPVNETQIALFGATTAPSQPKITR